MIGNLSCVCTRLSPPMKSMATDPMFTLSTWWSRSFLDRILDLNLDGFSPQNVINGLSVRQTPQGYELELHPCYGLSVKLIVAGIRLEIEPQRDKEAL